MGAFAAVAKLKISYAQRIEKHFMQVNIKQACQL
jgi:hypothetical protein